MGFLKNDGHMMVTIAPRSGSEIIHATHDLSDPTTWYSESVRVTGETLTDSGDGLTFDMANANAIDMTHGKVLDEDTIVADQGSHGYAVKVYVDAVEKTQRAPFAASGGDYTVNYAAGTVTFASSQSGNTVTADYSYEDGSCFIFAPASGKVLDIESAEAQFSDDITYDDTIIFEVYGYVEVFAPHLTPSPYPAGTKIPILTTKYKRLDQIIDEAMGSFPVIPAMGGARGTAKPRYGFPFRYGTIRRLENGLGMELRVKLENDTPFGGERATATFYCTSHDE